jgi:hypothetical protein
LVDISLSLDELETREKKFKSLYEETSRLKVSFLLKQTHTRTQKYLENLSTPNRFDL